MNDKSRFCSWLDKAIQVFLPPRCLNCHTPIQNDFFCPLCQHSIEHLPLSHFSSGNGFVLYQGAIRDAILKAKFTPNEAIAHQLMRYWRMHFAQHISSNWASEFAGVSFVPIHWKRRFKRGYDFSSLFARTLANTLQLPCWDLLRCVRFDSPMSTSSHAEERMTKVINKYACRDKFKTNHPILLVDDILTTGATLQAAASTLNTNGFRVQTIAFAQTPLHNNSRLILNRGKT